AKVPDVSFYRRERLPLDASGELISHPMTPPDLVGEIFSPGQEEHTELLHKAAWYLEQGVRIVLLVEPNKEHITAFTAYGEDVFSNDQPLPLQDVLPGLQLTPAEIFSALKS